MNLDDLPRDEEFEVLPKIGMRFGQRWEHAVAFERPVPVHEPDRDKKLFGTHERAAIAVELTLPTGGDPWRRVVWVPYTQYLGMFPENERTVTLPNGDPLRLMFGRTQHKFPTFQVGMVDFEMIAYDHRGAPRDYRSTLLVEPTTGGFEPFTHVTKLNSPLMAPFNFADDRSMIANLIGRIASGISPDQYKLSQAGWDRAGWQQTQLLVDQGMMERPSVQFTILGVGNNPGIHIVAFGSVLMALGIPWAFYIKPLLIKRKKLMIQRGLAAQNNAEGAGAGR